MWRTVAEWNRSVLAVAVAAALVACGGDDDAADSEPRDEEEVTSSSTTSTTQPSAENVEDVRPFLETLLGEWDQAMTEILADPASVEEDPAHPLRVQLAESFTEDSPYVEDLGPFLAGYVNQDAGLRPGSSGEVQQTTLVGFSEGPNDGPDFVSFVFCSYSDAEGFALSTGESRPPGVVVTPGSGEARRVDGEWRLHRLRQLGREEEPAGTPDPCKDMTAEE